MESARSGATRRRPPDLLYTPLDKTSQGWSISYWFHLTASPLGFAYALAGHLDQGLPLLEDAVETAAARGWLGGHSLRLAQLGEGYRLAGRMDDAITLSRRALDLSLKHNERGNQAWALRLLGEVAAHRDPPRVEDAQHHYGQALALATELGMRPLVAHCHAGLANINRRAAEQLQTDEHFQTATEMYRETGMTYWLDKLHTELRTVR